MEKCSVAITKDSKPVYICKFYFFRDRLSIVKISHIPIIGQHEISMTGISSQIFKCTYTHTRTNVTIAREFICTYI